MHRSRELTWASLRHESGHAGQFLDCARLQISTSIKKLPPGHTKTMQPQSGGPQARQGRIYKPAIRSKLNPKRSYNSTGAFWWASHPMLLLVALRRINRPGNHITACWVSVPDRWCGGGATVTRGWWCWGRLWGWGGVGYMEIHPTTRWHVSDVRRQL